jgi:hypothetical protein
MTLDDKDIIQVDASLSAGVLIFLTLANVSGFKNPVFPTQIFLTLLVIIPFSISAIFVVFENITQGSHLKYRFRKYALMLMTAGFIYLVAAVILLFMAAFNIHK